MKTKALLLNEIIETGFYCAIDDKEKEIIFEVIDNTDDVWLKENPNDKYLIDEWLYDYTDYDDRKVYAASGNLVSINNASPCEVYRLKEKYKLFGNLGEYLIEDKPTYKEMFLAKEQECERLKKQYNCYACGTCKGREDYKNIKRHCENAISQIHKYQQAFDSFEDICRNLLDDEYVRNIANSLLDIINKVNGDE